MKFILALLVAVFFPARVGIAQVDCSEVANNHIEIFMGHSMEMENVNDVLLNKCTGKNEAAAVEMKPGEGKVISFVGGDIEGDLEKYAVLVCSDGRSFVKNIMKDHLICDTR